MLAAKIGKLGKCDELKATVCKLRYQKTDLTDKPGDTVCQVELVVGLCAFEIGCPPFREFKRMEVENIAVGVFNALLDEGLKKEIAHES